MLASTFYLIVGGVIGVIAMSGIGGGVYAHLSKGSRARKRLFGEYVPKRDGSLPERVNEELNGLRQDAAKLLDLQQFDLAKKVGEVISLTQELFGKFKSAEDTHKANMAAVNYSDVLAKLNEALSDTYYFDLIANPSKWTRVEERKALVHGVADALADELLQAIRDFNSHADIHHDVNLESVLQRADATAILNDLR